MIKIPKVILIVALATYAYSVQCQESNLYTLNEDRFAVEFNSTWDIYDLAAVKSQLAEIEIELKFDLLEFYPDGGLRKMNASIKYPDGMSGSFKTRDLGDGDGPGFRRDLQRQPLPNRK